MDVRIAEVILAASHTYAILYTVEDIVLLLHLRGKSHG